MSRTLIDWHMRSAETRNEAPTLSFNPDPTVLDYRHALDFQLTVGPVNFVR